MNKYNLVEEPWISCLMQNGKVEEFNLLDVFAKANDIKEISDDSPLVVVSLHRLLLAILHRNFGPKNFEEWKTLWRKGSWDVEILQSYFDEWKDRFNLFDDERPFYQYPQIKKAGGNEVKIAPLELLMQQKAAGNNATLFDHSVEANPDSYSPAVAVRYLIARQSFSFRGGVSYPFNFANATLVSGFSVLATGDNLFETLALNLVIYHRDKPIPIQVDDEGSLDEPFWERKTLIQATEHEKDGLLPLGYLDYLTWQSRRIKLIPDEDLQTVKTCQLQQNFKLKESTNLFDPFKVYVKGDDGFYPKNLSEDKSLWRDSHTLFQQTNSIQGRSSLFSHLANVAKFISNNEISGRNKYSFSIFGVINDQANVKLWTQENLPLPLIYLNENSLLNDLETAIKFAEDIARDVLKSSLNKLAWELQPNIAGKDRSEKARKIADNFLSMLFYWSSLEAEFYKLLVKLPNSKDDAMCEWFSFVDKTAKEAFNKTANSLSGSAMEQKAIVNAQGLLNGTRNKLINGNSIYQEFLPNYKTKGGST